MCIPAVPRAGDRPCGGGAASQDAGTVPWHFAGDEAHCIHCNNIYTIKHTEDENGNESMLKIDNANEIGTMRMNKCSCFRENRVSFEVLMWVCVCSQVEIWFLCAMYACVFDAFGNVCAFESIAMHQKTKTKTMK